MSNENEIAYLEGLSQEDIDEFCDMLVPMNEEDEKNLAELRKIKSNSILNTEFLNL